MKIAIIGAGISGLACAHELEKYGISPVIYERNSFIGEQYPHVGSILNIASRPIKNPLKYLKSKFDIDIKPLNSINTLIHYSPNKTSTIKGNFGYFFYRGKESNDIKNQLFSMLKTTEIRFNKKVYYNSLDEDYDYIIVANGEPSLTNELGCWHNWFQSYVKGATVLGDFDPNAQIMWINKNYCKNGYAYLAPYNHKKAYIVHVVTDADEKEVDHYWEEFIYKEKINYTIVDEFKLFHVAGYTYPYRLNNIYFIGDAAGAKDSFLGFGQFNSITTGVMAARSIVNGYEYDKLIKRITKNNNRFYEFRKAFNNLSNDKYDIIVALIGVPGIKHIIYKSPLNITKFGAYFLK